MSDLSDRPDLPEDLTAPPVRRAPDALRHRIDRELRATQSRTIGPRHVIAPIAAVGLLVAGLLGAAQINTQQDVVPAQSPSHAKTSTPTAAISKVGTPSPSPSAPSSAPSSADPNAALAMRPMTRSELDQQIKACLKVPKGATAEPRQGKMKVAYAMQQAVAGYPTDGAVRPVLVLEDDLGYYYCSNGEKTWSSKNGDHITVDPSAAGHDLPTISGASSFTCGADEDDAQIESSAVVSITSAAAKTARVTIITRSGKRTVTIGVHQGYLAVPVQVNGAAAWSRSTLRFELLDAADRPLEVQSYGAQTTRRLDYATLSCADVQPHPTPTIKHPASDSAGVDRCRILAAQYLDSGHSGSINLKKATARVTVSTKGEWGAVLSDGKHYVGCSLFPTEEISSIRRVTPGTGVAAFGWAANPINPHGDSLWAAGYLPGATKISYGLPDGSTVDAKISSSGYWMVKTHTAEAFDTEEYTADWAKIKISVTRSGLTTTYSIPWTEKTMCNQVSHGC